MGGGSWSPSSATSYYSSRGFVADEATGSLKTDLSAQAYFKKSSLSPTLDPYNVVRECRNSNEHPNTVPVILALDVTGSMGSAAMTVAKKLGEIMTKLYNEIADVEFCIMGIGDLAYDDAPIQMSQFESDIRIAEQLDEIYFEGGGGGNSYESYTAAWYMGARHTALDCWEQGRKGIIITLGDEPLNPCLRARELALVTGDKVQDDIETKELYKEVCEKFDVYHIAVDDNQTSCHYYKDEILRTFGKVLGDKLSIATLDSLPVTITEIIKNSTCALVNTSANNLVSW